jgi:hypothetical protein
MAFKKKNEFFHSSETIRHETGIKKHSLNTIIKKFIALEIISIEVKGMPNVKYFTVHFPKIVELFPKIYQLSENGQLQPNFSKHLADFFIPLVDNYQEKNNIKNNKNNNKEKEERESEEEFVLSSFNNFLSELKYKNKISPAALKFNEIDLFRALNEYEIEIICEYLEKYFKDENRPTLIKFFTFDAISVNKLKYIEQKIVDENEYTEQLLNELQRIYDKRIEMYNKDDEHSRAKSKTKLVVTSRIKQQLKTALNYRNELQITHSFTAYTDDLLKGNLSISKILPYFLSSKEGEYEIIDTYLEYFNIQYGYSKN